MLVGYASKAPRQLLDTHPLVASCATTLVLIDTHANPTDAPGPAADQEW